MATRIGSDGAMENVSLEAAAIEAMATAKAREMAGEIQVSRTQARLERLLRGDEKPVCERVEIEGEDEPFWIRRLDLEGLTRIGLLAARNRRGELILAQEGHFRGLMAAMLFVCVVEDQDSATPLFTRWEMAYDFAHSTREEVIHINSVLFDRILQLNPDILPKSKKGDEEEDADEGESDFLEHSPLTTRSSS
ncbi:MAG: hypothetical protein KY445_04725 [Armatimonadetes bacterium]|nr:hypothetical protein [Armatimonadota bacterium]